MKIINKRGKINMNNIKEYLPFIIPILAATLGYIFGQRTTKINRFYTQNENNLKNVIEPLFLSLKMIMKEDSAFKRKKLLDDLFKTYLLEKKGIYQIGNKDLIDKLFYVEGLYKEFKKKQKEEEWKDFWIELNYFYNAIKNEYWNNFYTLYKEYRWYLHSLDKNMFVRFFYEIIRLLKETVNSLTLLSFGFLFFCIYDRLITWMFDKGVMPEDSITFSIILLIFCIAMYCFISVFDALSPDSSQQKNYIDKLVRKGTNKNKSFEKKITVPPMYKQ